MTATCKPYEIDPGVATSGLEGSPAPIAGDAVHYEPSDGKFYLANPLTRRNIIGIKDGDGNIIRVGPCGGLSGLSANSMYYLKWPALSLGISTAVTTGDNFDVRQDVTDEFSQAQTFPGSTGKIIGAVGLALYTNGTPTGYDGIYLILKEAGTGVKTTLARSEMIPLADIPTSWDSASENLTWFRFFDPYVLATGTNYMICVCANSNGVDATNYIRVRGQAAGDGYASGKRYYSSGEAYGIPEEWEYWSDPADGSDLYMQIYWFDVSSFSPNITTSHPFEHSDSDITCYHPVIKLGRALTSSEIDLNIERMETIAFYENWTDEIVYTSAITDQIVYDHLANITTYGCERLLLLYRAKVSNVSHSCVVMPCWNFTKTTMTWDTISNKWLNKRPNRSSFIHSVNGRGQLGYGFEQDNTYSCTIKGISLLGG